MMDQVSMMDKLLPDTSSCAQSTVRPNRNGGIWSRESFIAGAQGKWGLTHTQKRSQIPQRVSAKHLFFIIFFYFTILHWFCHTSTCICHGCTRVPHPETPSYLPPYSIPLGHPSAPAPSFLYPASNLDSRFVSYMILYVF